MGACLDPYDYNCQIIGLSVGPFNAYSLEQETQRVPFVPCLKNARTSSYVSSSEDGKW